MEIISSYKKLSSTPICVPGSKSHTIRALLLAALADGVSCIKNPLPSADCFSAVNAIKAFGAKIDIGCDVDKNGLPIGDVSDTWCVKGAGKNAHLPSCCINVGNSGSTLYFFTPVAATFLGSSTFTGDSSICKRPVKHLLDALQQLGAKAYTNDPNSDSAPFTVEGPISAGTVTTDGRLSQYISGLMMASVLLDGELTIHLTDPKEVPYLKMTQSWLKSVGVTIDISSDYKKIKTFGKKQIQGFNATIPSDWESVAFPLIAALISKSNVVIDGIDITKSQGDEKIIDILTLLGANIKIKTQTETTGTLFVNGEDSKNLSTMGKGFENDIFRINISNFPDAVCALATIACFIEGTIVLDDVAVCRQKETDRIKVLVSELGKLGGTLIDGLSLAKTDPLYGNCLIIRGAKDKLKGGIVESHGDHRIAMSLACFGLGIKGDQVTVKNAECCNVSFPNFVETMNSIGADFCVSQCT